MGTEKFGFQCNLDSAHSWPNGVGLHLDPHVAITRADLQAFSMDQMRWSWNAWCAGSLNVMRFHWLFWTFMMMCHTDELTLVKHQWVVWLLWHSFVSLGFWLSLTTQRRKPKAKFSEVGLNWLTSSMLVGVACVLFFTTLFLHGGVGIDFWWRQCKHQNCAHSPGRHNLHTFPHTKQQQTPQQTHQR